MHCITGPTKRCGLRAALSLLVPESRAGKFAAATLPNEAGESTPFKALARLFAFDEDEIEGAGYLLQRTLFSTRGRLGMAPHQMAPGMGLRTRQNRLFHAYLHGLPRAAALEHRHFALHGKNPGPARRMALDCHAPSIGFVCSGCAPQRGFGCVTQRVGDRS